MKSPLSHGALCMLLFCFSYNTKGQAAHTVSEIITNYNGYFKSGFTSFNPVKPDNSHELLAFTYRGVRYSTGVNDALLRSNGEDFSAQAYKSLPVNGISGTVTGNTKIGVGQMYDGVHNGASNPPPVNDMVYYLTDGANGLDLGTGVANLPIGQLIFKIGSINPLAIGDGIPDIIITQFADPSSGVDRYEFLKDDDTRVGKLVDISFSGIQAVANWTADFYEASHNPLILTKGFTNTDRPIRIWAADFSDFGITTANYEQVKRFVINLNGQSDVAFVAYNARSAFSIVPVRFTAFHSFVRDGKVELQWQLSHPAEISEVTIERSADGHSFTTIGRIYDRRAESVYRFTDDPTSDGLFFYRLRIRDYYGHETVSQILSERIGGSLAGLHAYPNPATKNTIVQHPSSSPGDHLALIDNSGKVLMVKQLATGSSMTSLQVAHLPPGFYTVRFTGAAGTMSVPLLIRKAF